MIELEFLIERCWESAQEYEKIQAEERGYDEQLANFISNEEREMNEYYAELENSIQQEREYQENLHNQAQYQEYQANLQNQHNQAQYQYQYQDDDFM